MISLVFSLLSPNTVGHPGNQAAYESTGQQHSGVLHLLSVLPITLEKALSQAITSPQGLNANSPQTPQVSEHRVSIAALTVRRAWAIQDEHKAVGVLNTTCCGRP